jgi:hypothetical protein
MKNLIYIALIVILSLAIRGLADYPFWLTIAGLGWCVSCFLLLKNLIETKINNKNK